MNKFFKRMFLILLAVMLLVPCIAVLAETTKEQLDDAKKKEQEMQQRLANVKRQINSLKSNMTSLENYIKELDNEMVSLAEEIEGLNINIENKNLEIAATRIELDEAIETQKHQYEFMKLRIQFMYEHNDRGYLDMIFSADSLADLLNKAEYVQEISDYDRKKLEEYAAAKQRVTDTLERLETEEHDLQNLKADVQNSMDAVQLLMDAKNEELNELEASKGDLEKQQKEYEASMRELDNLVQKLTAQYDAEQLAKANAVATQENLYAKKLLIWPCPSSYRITSNFNPTRLDPVLGYVRAHNGTDIAASIGTPVVAAASGLVTAAGYSASMGNYVIIAHGDGITTRYYHNSRLAVSAGQAVQAGQVISYAGATGWVTGPHLHFEVRINEVAVNAMQFY